MEARVQIGASANLQLRHAVLVYTEQQRAFATLHDVISQEEGAPLLASAQPISPFISSPERWPFGQASLLSSRRPRSQTRW